MRYRSGLWRERLGLGGSLYTTQRLYGRERKPGSGLLKPEQEGFAVLGEAFADLRVTARIMAHLFRHTIDFKPSEGMLRGLWVRARAPLSTKRVRTPSTLRTTVSLLN